jgi:hypothetical protein
MGAPTTGERLVHRTPGAVPPPLGVEWWDLTAGVSREHKRLITVVPVLPVRCPGAGAQAGRPPLLRGCAPGSSPVRTSSSAMSRTFRLAFIDACTSSWKAWSGVSLYRSMSTPLAWSMTARDSSAAWRLSARSRALW